MKQFLYSTQKRYVEEVSNSWLKRLTSAVFEIPFDDFQLDQFLFTLGVSICHGISLEAQKVMLETKVNSFTDFYREHLGWLPAVVLFNDEVNLDWKKGDYYLADDGKVSTYKYYKIKEIWDLSKISFLYEFCLDDVLKAEKDLSFPLEITYQRFFSKFWEDRKNIEKTPYISNSQMYSFSMWLARIVYEKMRWKIVN